MIRILVGNRSPKMSVQGQRYFEFCPFVTDNDGGSVKRLAKSLEIWEVLQTGKPVRREPGRGEEVGSAYGNRTRLSALRGPCPNR
jgi:hypothetical protein